MDKIIINSFIFIIFGFLLIHARPTITNSSLALNETEVDKAIANLTMESELIIDHNGTIPQVAYGSPLDLIELLQQQKPNSQRPLPIDPWAMMPICRDTEPEKSTSPWAILYCAFAFSLWLMLFLAALIYQIRQVFAIRVDFPRRRVGDSSALPRSNGHADLKQAGNGKQGDSQAFQRDFPMRQNRFTVGTPPNVADS